MVGYGKKRKSIVHGFFAASPRPRSSCPSWTGRLIADRSLFSKIGETMTPVTPLLFCRSVDTDQSSSEFPHPGNGFVNPERLSTEVRIVGADNDTSVVGLCSRAGE